VRARHFRRIEVNPGQAAAVAALIQAEYVPLVSDIDGFVSNTLVDVGDDEVASLGTFATADSADAAHAAAQAWTEERLAPLVASALETRVGAVLVQTGVGDE